MAAVSVSANNTRVEDAESGTGWANIGGGAGGAAEGSFPYQGSNLYNRKVTGTAGFYYDPTTDSGSAQDMTATATRTMMVKAIVTDYGGLNATSGLRIRIGSATTAYYQFVIAGTASPVNSYDDYPARGGLFIIPIDPNIAAYRDSTTGSPALSAVDYFGLEANFTTSTAKSENVGLDAIDLGTGLTLTGGDGVDTDGTYQDFVDNDEGTTSNRWGYASSVYGSIFVFFGTMTIGSATATGFTDTTSKIVWADGMFQAGWSGVAIGLQSASTAITDGSTQTGLGSTTTEDTRPDYIVTGTSGTLTLSATLENFRNIVLTSGCTVSNADIEAADVTVSTATISNTTFRTNTASGVALINDFSAANMSDTTFVQVGSGHAIEITSPGSYNFDNLQFSGYGGTAGSNLIASSGANDAMIYNNSGGAVTINITNGGTTVSVRNAASSTTTVNNTVSVRVVTRSTSGAVVSSARVRLEADTLASGTHTGTSGASVLTDSSKSFTTNEFVGFKIYNTTDGSSGTISANTATTVTATLSGGAGNDWDNGDAYIIIGSLPSDVPVSITSASTTATVTHTAHGLATGDKVVIRGANQDEYNKIATITVTDANTYTYTITSGATTPATGTITSTAIILDNTTDGSGILQNTGFNYISDLPVRGVARKGTSSPYYKTTQLTGTITSAGYNQTALMIRDD